MHHLVWRCFSILMEVGFIGLTVAKVSMTTAALSLAYTCLEVVTEVVEAISITEAVEVVDAPARIIAQCTELLTSYNCYSSRTDRSSTVRYAQNRSTTISVDYRQYQW